jgi:hypothetical protein
MARLRSRLSRGDGSPALQLWWAEPVWQAPGPNDLGTAATAAAESIRRALVRFRWTPSVNGADQADSVKSDGHNCAVGVAGLRTETRITSNRPSLAVSLDDHPMRYSSTPGRRQQPHWPRSHASPRSRPVPARSSPEANVGRIPARPGWAAAEVGVDPRRRVHVSCPALSLDASELLEARLAT